MADFDPDTFLQNAEPPADGAFDPDAFLASPHHEDVSTLGDVAKSGGIGVVKGGLGLAGMPGDARELTAHGVSAAARAAGFDIAPETVSNVMRFMPLGPMSGPSSQEMRGGLEKVTGPLYEPKTTAGEYAQTAGEFLPAVIGGPETLGAKLATRVAIPAVTSETAGQLTKGTAAEPFARAAGAVGPALIQGAAPAAKAIRSYFDPLTAAGQERVAAGKLASNIGDREEFEQALDNPSAELVPGSKPTTFQQTGDMQLGALEKDIFQQNRVPFMERRSEQNTARLEALENLQRTGDPSAVAAQLRNRLTEIDDAGQTELQRATEEAQNRAAGIGGIRSPESYGEEIQGQVRPLVEAREQAAEQATQGLGGAGTPDQYGASLRDAMATAKAAAKARERTLWRAVDPDGTLAMPASSIKTSADGLAEGISNSAKPLSGEEAAIIETARGYNSVMPFSEVTDLRSRISTAMREELRSAGETPTYGRLTRLRGAVETAINNAVEHQAAQEAQAVNRGVLSPEQTMAARLAAEQRAWYESRGNIGQDAIGNAAAGSSAVPGSSRAQIPVRNGPGNATGDQGLQDLEPNFDEAARDRLRAATAATRERIQTFNQGPVGAGLKTQGQQGNYATLDAAVPGMLFRSGPKGFETVQAFRRAIGNDEQAIETLQAAATSSLRRDAERDGVLVPKLVQSWLDNHQDALRAFPALRQRFSNAADAAETARNFSPITGDSAAHVPEQFFHPGVGGFEDVGRLRTLIGDASANSVLSDYAASRLRATAMRPDGTIDPAKFATWQRQHADALRAFPGLADRFSTAARASESIENAIAARKEAIDNFTSGAIAKLMDVTDPSDVTKTIGSIFGTKDAVKTFGLLASDAARDPAAKEGLRKAVADHITNKLISNTEAATSGKTLLKSDQFQTFIKANEAALSKVFNPEEIASMKAVAADLQRANRSLTAVKIPGGSDTAQNQASQHVSMFNRWLRHSMHSGLGAAVGSLAGMIGAGLGGAGGEIVAMLRDAGMKKVDDIVTRALLDPAFAKTLLTKAPTENPAASRALKKQLARMSLFGIESGEEHREDRNTVSRASGGAVLPISTRKESNYSPTRGKPDHHCGPDKVWKSGYCKFFKKPHACEKIAGFIAARGGCDLWQSALLKRADGGSVTEQNDDILSSAMVDPLQDRRGVGTIPAVQEGVRSFGNSLIKPFDSFGKLLTGNSNDILGDMITVGAAALPIGPPGSGAGLKSIGNVAKSDAVKDTAAYIKGLLAKEEPAMVEKYNADIPSIKKQYYDWASPRWTYEKYTPEHAEEVFGDNDEWPSELREIIDRHGHAINSAHESEGLQFFAPHEAPTLEQHMERAVQEGGGLLPARDLNDVMSGLASKTSGAISAASEAFAHLAEKLGWKVAGGNPGKYFTIHHPNADHSLDVRVSDHPNLTKSNPNATMPDINLAPGAHDFEDAARIMHDAATPQIARASGGRINDLCGPTDILPEHQSETEWRSQPAQGIGEPEPLERASGGRVMAHYIDPNPSEAQKSAGNYRKFHTSIWGIPLAIENAKGSERSGVGPDGKEWKVPSLPYHYGYAKKTEAKDGDAVDVMLGPHTQSRKVFIVDQHDAETGKYDEAKALMGYGSSDQAKAVYLKGFSDGKGHKRLGHMTEMDIDTFKDWLRNGNTTKPLKDSGHDFPKIDHSRDVRAISELSKGGDTFYYDRSLPRRITLNGKPLDPVQPLLRHEVAEYKAMKTAIDAFKSKYGREPSAKERGGIYKKAHLDHGNIAERKYLVEKGYDIKAWNNWCRGVLARVEKEKTPDPPPNPDVRPIPHTRGDLEVTVR